MTASRRPSRPEMRHNPIAAPSFIWPADIAENCGKLQGLVDEVGLLFFQSEACLAYTEQDLPQELASNGLSYHVHLPLDLPWAAGLGDVWEILSGLRGKAAVLQPWAFVLHPPSPGPLPASGCREGCPVCPSGENIVASGDRAASLGTLAGLWERADGFADAALLLENTPENDLVGLWPLIQSSNLGICLDLGHLLAFDQNTHRLPDVWSRVRMVHLSAPGGSGPDGRRHDGHRSLAALDKCGRSLLDEILGQVRPDCVLMVEVFEPEGFLESLQMLRAMTGRG